MARFAKQVYQVFLVYATTFRFWGCLIMTAIVVGISCAGEPSEHRAQMASIYVTYPCLIMMFLYSETVLQFAHSRSKVVPGFNLPHLIIPVAYSVLVGLFLPYAMALRVGGSTIKFVAIASVTLGVVLSLTAASRATVPLILLGIYVVSNLMQRSFLDLVRGLDLTLVHYLGLIFAGWAMSAFNLHRLTTIREDSRVYLRLLNYAQQVSSSTKRGDTSQPSHQVTNWLYERCVVTTSRFHNGNPYRLIHLLQRGVGSVPAELQAICCVVLAIAAWLMMRPDGTEVVADPITSMPLIFAIAACLLPGIFASASLMHHRFHLSKQVLLPLKRKRLIDCKLLTVAWNTLLLWLSLGLATLVTIWDFPGLQLTIPLAIGFLVLSLSIAVVQFAVGMSIALSKSNFVQQFTFIVFPLGELVLVLFWWAQRDALTDLPFMVLAGFALALATVVIGNARRAWMEVEVGRDHV